VDPGRNRAERSIRIDFGIRNAPTCTSLPEATELPPGKRTGYGGPCPPVGRHRYFHKVYALDVLPQAAGRIDSSRARRAPGREGFRPGFRAYPSEQGGLMRAATFVGIAFVAVLAAGRPAASQENTGQQVQGLVGGTLVDVREQERLTLLSLSVGCSASLLRNGWAITAAHCVETAPLPGSNHFVTEVPAASIRVTANWSETSPQARRVRRFVRLRPADVALLELDRPFMVEGSFSAVDRRIWDGALTQVPVTLYGRGIFAYAIRVGPQPVAALSDGRYRMTTGTMTGTQDGLVWMSTREGTSLAGGDSGGPSFVSHGNVFALLGVHALCRTRCLPGQTCDSTTGWMWIAHVESCADAPIQPLWTRILEIIGPFRPVVIPGPTGGVSGPANPRPPIP
jgi:hypothetical protein